MDQSKKKFLPVLQGVKLSKTQSLTTKEDRKRMTVIPYAKVIGSIKYVVLCTRPIVHLAMSLARGYNSDLRVDHWTSVKIILGDGGDKEFVVKSYVDAKLLHQSR